jgi:hypothetical protein
MPAVSAVLPHDLRQSEGGVVEADKEAGLDPAAATTASKLVIKADPVFQPPSAAAELPHLGAARPRRRRRAAK